MVAKSIGGKTTVASGAKWNQKADVRHSVFLLECKTTEAMSYRLTQQTWEKITLEALRDGGKIPLMSIQVEDGKYDLIVMNYFDFIGVDFDKNRVFVGDEPIITESLSFNVSANFLKKPLNVVANREFFKFERVRVLGYKEFVIFTFSDFCIFLDKFMKDNNLTAK